MIGISGNTLGLVLRAKNKSYREIGKVAVVFGLVMAFLSFIGTLIFGEAILDIAMTGSFLAGFVSTIASSFVLAIWVGLTFGIVGLISLYIGALIWDIVQFIIDN